MIVVSPLGTSTCASLEQLEGTRAGIFALGSGGNEVVENRFVPDFDIEKRSQETRPRLEGPQKIKGYTRPLMAHGSGKWHAAHTRPPRSVPRLSAALAAEAFAASGSGRAGIGAVPGTRCSRAAFRTIADLRRGTRGESESVCSPRLRTAPRYCRQRL